MNAVFTLFHPQHNNTAMINDHLVSFNERSFHSLLSSALLVISIPTFLVLLGVISAPYGKHSSPSSSQKNRVWGPTLNARLAWFLFESPNLLWSILCFYHKDEKVFWSLSSSDPHSSSFTLSANPILFILFVIHYIHRCIVYPSLRMNPQSQPVNLTVILSAFFFCCWNGYLQARSLCTFQMYPKGHHNTSSFRIGVVLWLVGAAINIHSDSILLNLRVRSNALKREYYIPQGGLFHYVSAANYFGEIVEWGGFALACQTKSAFAFWFFVCANLMPRAHSHHRWYKEKFDDYPINRKAIIPFIW